MQRRALGTTGWDVTEVGLGTWNIGGAAWGDVPEEAGREVVRTALDAGIDFLDTADVYGDGTSERHIGAVLEADGYDREEGVVATKAGRRLDPHTAEVFDALDELKARGKIAHYGVSVETVEPALKGMSTRASRRSRSSSTCFVSVPRRCSSRRQSAGTWVSSSASRWPRAC